MEPGLIEQILTFEWWRIIKQEFIQFIWYSIVFHHYIWKRTNFPLIVWLQEHWSEQHCTFFSEIKVICSSDWTNYSFYSIFRNNFYGKGFVHLHPADVSDFDFTWGVLSSERLPAICYLTTTWEAFDNATEHCYFSTLSVSHTDMHNSLTE